MQNSEQTKPTSSRRAFALGAGLAGLATAAQKASAQTAGTGSNSDLAVLNYALTLEHLEATFYTQGLNNLKAADFNASTFAQVLGPGTVNGVYSNLQRIRDHEIEHVRTLQSVIKSLGGTPVDPCTYKFSYKTGEEFLRIALALEETGVQAYDGAIAMIASAALKRAGASIATVEARHAAYLQLVNAAIPFPNAFDQTKTMKEILATASQFITSCAGTPVGALTTAILLPKNLVTLSQQITLDAGQSLSANGMTLTFETKSVGSRTAAVLQGSTASPQVQFASGPGDYIFELTATDSAGGKSTDRITVQYVGR